MTTGYPFSGMTGPDFLLFDATLTAVAFLLVLVLRERLRATGGGRPVRGLNPLELAYLAGGPNRAAATVAVGFFSAGAAMLDERKQRLTIATDGIVLPNELEPLRTCAQGVVQCKDFRAAVLPRLEPVHAELVARGLCPAPNLLTWYRLAGLVVLAVPVLIGVIRACVGAARDRPIGFLLILLMLTLFFGLLLLCPGPICTHAGTRAVRASTKTHARAVRAPLMEELNNT